MTKLAPEWVRTTDPVIRSPARYRWTTAPAICYMWEPRDRVLANAHHSQSCMTGSLQNVWANIPVIFALNGHNICPKWLCVPYSRSVGIFLLRLDLCAIFWSNRAIIDGDITYQLNWACRNCLGIYLVIDTLLCTLSCFTPVCKF